MGASLSKENRRENFELAFRVAEEMGQEPLLEVDDCVDLPYPDSLSVMTLVFGCCIRPPSLFVHQMRTMLPCVALLQLFNCFGWYHGRTRLQYASISIHIYVTRQSWYIRDCPQLTNFPMANLNC